jgi:outer membrane receptor protein involved in Fe transport
MDGRLVPTVGLRYYNDKREAIDLRDGVRSKAERSFSSVNPRFNLAYKPADGKLYYLNIAKGFRSGALQSTAAVAAATAAGLPASAIMPQDSLWSYEVGGKWNTDRRIAVEVAVYAIDWKDAQITNLLVGAGGVTTTIISGGNDVRGYGIDFGLTWATPVRGLSAQFATNRNNLEFKKVPRNTIARVDQQIPGSPKQSATLALDYRRPVGALEFSTNVSFNYRGAQNEMTTAKESDSIRDWRLRIGVGSEKWDVSVYGLNLNDQRGVSAILSAAVVNPIQPRKVGIDANFRF